MNEQPGPAATDFLDRLVGKVRGEDSGLQPRLSSLFEPIRHVRMDVAVDAESAGLVDERAADTRRTARDESVVTVQQAAPIAETQPREAVTAHTPRPHEPVPSPEAEAETAPVAAASPALIPLVVARPRHAIEPLGAPEDRDGLAPTPPRLRVSKPLLADAAGDSAPTHDGALTPPAPGEARSNHTASRQVSAREPVRRAMADEAAEARHAGRPPTKAGALLPSPDPGVRRVVVEAQTTRRRSAPESARAESPTVDHTPVVNVTIGRVEVRAVQAPPTQPQRRSDARGPRPMSLEEYLKQRESGR